jgi:imidazole glycerol-phosphate synthase subunit HisH
MKPRVAIVGFGMGNINSVRNAFLSLDVDVRVTESPAELEEATHIVLPGVGAFPEGMEKLEAQEYVGELRRLALEEGRPLIGLCLGMQLLATEGEEHRLCPGLNLIPGRVVQMETHGLRLPHIGWNDTVALRESPLQPAGSTSCYYYVHSFRYVPEDPADAVLSCEYGETFAAGVQRENVMGVQFHPEKSHRAGIALLKRFTETGS